MSQTISELLRQHSAQIFVVQFVLTVEVENAEEPAIEINTYLIPANSIAEAHQVALGMMESLADRYRNREGEIVSTRCEGVHSVEELEHADWDGRLELSTFLFTRTTQPGDLIRGATRRDLPPLN